MSQHGKKILIVEDEKPLAKVMRSKFAKMDVEADLVTTGVEALAKLEENTYDLVLLDIIMPEMDGYTVLKSMKDKGDETPVVVLTNLGQEAEIEKTLSLGAKECYVKSDSSIGDILVCVNDMLES